jgi:5'' nucleotidase, deoxy (Pyrimidine), cytosolic type C protein (NT5C).
MDNQIILGIDIDGTLADTMELWLEFYREDYNVVVSKEDIVVYNMSKIFPEITFEKMREYFEKAWKNWEK